MSAPDTTPTPAPDAPVQPKRLEPLEQLERWWLRIGMVMLIAFLAIVLIDAIQNSTQHSHGSFAMAPEKVLSTPPFDNPGTFENKDGTWTAVSVAYTFGFLPKEDLVVPVDTDIHFKVSSVDVVHGFQIPGRSNVNLEVLPGRVSEVTQRFDTPGRYLILCHQYCGAGHHFMTSHIRVLKKGEDPKNPPPLDGSPEANTAAVEDAISSKDSNA